MLDIDTLAKIAEISTPILSVSGLGWWLRGKFNSGEKHTNNVMAAHEVVELSRFKDIFTMTRQNHTENLRNFRAVAVAIAKIKPDINLDLNGN